jgi:hypothetical protein
MQEGEIHKGNETMTSREDDFMGSAWKSGVHVKMREHLQRGVKPMTSEINLPSGVAIENDSKMRPKVKHKTMAH